MQQTNESLVAQASKPAVSPTSKSAACVGGRGCGGFGNPQYGRLGGLRYAIWRGRYEISRLSRPCIGLWVLAAGVLFCPESRAAQSAVLKFQVLLLWGTNDPRSPDPSHKPVEPEVKAKLNELPLKFTNYFEVNRKPVDVPLSGTNRVPLSEKCALEVKSLGGASIEVSLFGKGKQVVSRKQSLAKGEVLFVGGNAPNDTAWLVALKRIE